MRRPRKGRRSPKSESPKKGSNLAKGQWPEDRQELRYKGEKNRLDKGMKMRWRGVAVLRVQGNVAFASRCIIRAKGNQHFCCTDH